MVVQERGGTVFNEKTKLIQNLTGVNSSKLNYYVELKKRNEEIVKQNSRLEIIHQLVRDINIEMSVADLIKRVYGKLPLAVPCDFIGLALYQDGKLLMKAMMPRVLYGKVSIPRGSFLWECVEEGKGLIYEPASSDPFIQENPDLGGQICSLAAAPLFCRSAVRGVLLVGSKVSRAYSSSELNFIHQLADQMAIAIQNTSLYKQVSRAKSEWEATFRAVTDPILLIDTDFNILRDNNNFPPSMDVTGRDSESQKCYARLWGRNGKCDECLMEETIREGKPVYKRVQMASGLVFDISYYPVYNEKGQITAVINQMKDVTEKTKMEAQLMQSAKLAAIGEMAAGVAHELNNQMTVIIGTAQLLLRDKEEGSFESEALKDIVNCGLRCKKIIQNLLTFSRQDRYPLAPTDLNDVVERVLSLIQYQINRNKIVIVKDLAPDLPRITANSQQIQQVLINFLLNARDALEGLEREGRIEISSSLREVEGEGKKVVVTVRDNGVGIEKENLPKIFNPFYTSKDASKGTGLGLSVSLGIAEAHGGCIEVDSTPGEGSTFSLVLPVDEETVE